LVKLVSRGDTAVVDAYLSPILHRYVEQVASALDLGRGVEQLQFMRSSGGLTDARTFQGKDAILSGPAGGIVGMVKTGVAAGYTQLIGFDMGGTSTDVSHFAGQYERSFETEVAGVRMRAPMMDIHTVAAGGGSICKFERGRFQVGPESAGANPGPAAYRRGGPLTVTDCNVVLGKLVPKHFQSVFGPNGDQPLDADAARARCQEIADQVAKETDETPRTLEDIAKGFLQIAVENMALAIKKISVQRGHDVSTYTLQCFGGAGGQHACQVADSLGMQRVLIHPYAGVLSAFGIGLAELRAIKERQLDLPISDVSTAMKWARALEADALAELEAQGVPEARTELRAHVRYSGTDQAIEVILSDQDHMAKAFESAHRGRFGFADPKRDLIIDMVTAEAIGLADPLPVLTPPDAADSAPLGQLEWKSAPLYQRSTLPENVRIPGPAVLAEDTATTVVEAGWTARIDQLANVILERTAPRADATEGGTQVDPVMLEVMSNLFMSVADQMGVALQNTSQSVNIKERLDFSCAVFDTNGDLVANAPHVPVHLGSMSHAVKTVISRFPDAGPGDAYVLNAPFDGGTHLPDITTVMPVFAPDHDREDERQPAFWLGTRGHHADVGGRTPGSAPPDSRRLEEEGVVILPQPLVSQGRFLEKSVRALLAEAEFPARNPDQNIADLKAQVAACETGRQELLKVVKHYSLATVQAYMDHVQDNAEESVRQAIATLKDGSFVYPMDPSPDGSARQIAVSVAVDREARSATVDFSGTSSQQVGNYNAPAAVARAVVLYVFRCLVGDDIPLNEGCL
ncbi:MAG: hydantoinase B/oxoprolinase family protein, partial [Pseudomonadota bacterium]